MRKILLILTGLLIISLKGFTQETMKVESFRVLENDMTARRLETKKLDVNGKEAALIKFLSPGDGFEFDFGSTGVVEVERKTGETWLYVPRGSKKLTVIHNKYGVLRDYEYPMAIKSGVTYELRLDPGIGKYMNITANQAGAGVFIDGDSIGVTPLTNYYIVYGKHSFRAAKDRFLFEKEVMIEQNDETSLYLDMENMSKYYVNVNFVTNDNSEIYYKNVKRGVGSWKQEFYKGKYELMTKKSNCYDQLTTVDIYPGMNTTVTLPSPEPWHGYLKINTTPLNATMTIDNNNAKVNEQHALTVGKHEVQITRKGYHPFNQTFSIYKDSLIEIDKKLSPIQYVKRNQSYIGAGYTYNTIMGISAYVGFTVFNFDVQASYTLGMFGETDALVWYKNDDYLGKVNYKQNVMAVKIGYQFKAAPRLAITPQAGFSSLQLVANSVDGSVKMGDQAKCDCVTLGARMEVVPTQHFGIFLSPEYMLPMKKDGIYEYVSDKLNMTAGGFYASAGFFVKF